MLTNLYLLALNVLIYLHIVFNLLGLGVESSKVRPRIPRYEDCLCFYYIMLFVGNFAGMHLTASFSAFYAEITSWNFGAVRHLTLVFNPAPYKTLITPAILPPARAEKSKPTTKLSAKSFQKS